MTRTTGPHWTDSPAQTNPRPRKAVATHRGLKLSVETTTYGSITAMVGGAFAGAHCIAFVEARASDGMAAAQIATAKLADTLAAAGWTAR